VTVALLDYGAGNLASVRKALAAAGAEVRTASGAADLAGASALVVPGVGHFGATAAIDADTRTAVRAALGEGRPVLGICLGMQWLFEGSDEAPGIPGLGLGLGMFKGTCFRLPSNGAVKVPHVGWNRLRIERAGRLLEGLDEGAYAYFTHSYAAPPTAAASAIATHGAEFAAAVERDLVFGVQFHPEKSGEAGLRILRNFVETARAR
jgi:imidazole glycerol-phosphate synthase subunit HisH